jgi:hypothetical protein
MPIETRGLSITPDVLSFGCICQGFVYQLQVNLTNKCKQPQRLRFVCTNENTREANTMTAIIEPKLLAMGISTTLTLELGAYVADFSRFKIKILQSEFPDEIIVIPVESFIVPIEIFKLMKRALTLEKREIYRTGVSLVGSTVSADERSALTGGPTVYSEVMSRKYICT